MSAGTKFRNTHTGEVESWQRDGDVMVSESGKRWSMHRLPAVPARNIPASPGFYECHAVAEEPEA